MAKFFDESGGRPPDLFSRVLRVVGNGLYKERVPLMVSIEWDESVGDAPEEFEPIDERASGVFVVYRGSGGLEASSFNIDPHELARVLLSYGVFGDLVLEEVRHLRVIQEIEQNYFKQEKDDLEKELDELFGPIDE